MIGVRSLGWSSHCCTIAGMPEVAEVRTKDGGTGNRLFGSVGEGAIPEQSAAQTFMEVDFGFVGEGGAGQ